MSVVLEVKLASGNDAFAGNEHDTREAVAQILRDIARAIELGYGSARAEDYTLMLGTSADNGTGLVRDDNGNTVGSWFLNISTDDEAGDDSDDYPDDSMDGDHESALASAGFGTDEDYGYYGDE